MENTQYTQYIDSKVKVHSSLLCVYNSLDFQSTQTITFLQQRMRTRINHRMLHFVHSLRRCKYYFFLYDVKKNVNKKKDICCIVCTYMYYFVVILKIESLTSRFTHKRKDGRQIFYVYLFPVQKILIFNLYQKWECFLYDVEKLQLILFF